jgi:prepilin-type N-terminal cleavage/methylation domain-containing protein/prepilin-type processing-associated H-X9-DG protein
MHGVTYEQRSAGTRHSSGSMSRQGFSFVELIVVIAILTLLLAIGVPAITRARTSAKKVECLNNLRNIALAVMQFEQTHIRLPASGYIFDPPSGAGAQHHSWAVSILPFLDQTNVRQKWDVDKPITDPTNAPLTQLYIPVYVCPVDPSRSDDKDKGDLSYVVNGGFGFTIRTGSGIADCPTAPLGPSLDLNGDGVACSGTPVDDEDRERFKQTGLFFLENWKEGGTIRHHALADIQDGASQTFLVTENIRAGFDPSDPQASYASPNPYICAFYVGLPCPGGNCRAGNVDYSRCNSGGSQINSGLFSPEGRSPVPNSFHDGGVNMAYADGHVSFLSASIDGAVYAALASPQGTLLQGTSLQQGSVSGDAY